MLFFCRRHADTLKLFWKRWKPTNNYVLEKIKAPHKRKLFGDQTLSNMLMLKCVTKRLKHVWSNTDKKNWYKLSKHFSFAPIFTCVTAVKSWPNEKCLATKHRQALFGDQTFYCLATLFGAVWSCLVVFDKTWDIRSNNLKYFFVLVFDGQCFVRLDSRVSNMFDAGMRTTACLNCLTRQCLVANISRLHRPRQGLLSHFWLASK